MSGATIVVDRISKTFVGRVGEVPALHDVSLSIEPGEVVVLIGRSGCGKTTLLRAIGGLEPISAGSISIDGVSPTAARQRRMFGLVPQRPALLPWRTVRANIGLLSEVGRDRSSFRTLSADDRVRTDELLAAVGLTAYGDAKPNELSGGMQQRVALARAVHRNAPVLLLDEPFAALDEITRVEMRSLLLALWSRTGATVVFTTHSLEEAVQLADRVVVMAGGPGRITDIVSVGLPRSAPAFEDDPRYLAALRSVRLALHGPVAERATGTDAPDTSGPSAGAQ